MRSLQLFYIIKKEDKGSRITVEQTETDGRLTAARPEHICMTATLCMLTEKISLKRKCFVNLNASADSFYEITRKKNVVFFHSLLLLRSQALLDLDFMCRGFQLSASNTSANTSQRNVICGVQSFNKRHLKKPNNNTPFQKQCHDYCGYSADLTLNNYLHLSIAILYFFGKTVKCFQ